MCELRSFNFLFCTLLTGRKKQLVTHECKPTTYPETLQLRTNAHILDRIIDPTSPLCKAVPQTLGYWLQRYANLGASSYTFGILMADPEEVLALALCSILIKHKHTLTESLVHGCFLTSVPAGLHILKKCDCTL